MEAAARRVSAKITAARSILTAVQAAPLVGVDAAAGLAALGRLEVRLGLATGPIYAAAATCEGRRRACAAEFERVLAAEDFEAEVDSVADRCAAAAAAHPPGRAAAQRLTRLLDVYPRGGETPPPPLVDYESCPVCRATMAVDSGRSELRCGECGAIRELVGTVFDDSQFYSQEGQKAKSGTFIPNRHFQFWWTRILAREPEDELGEEDRGAALFAALHRIIARDRRVLRLLTVDDVRAMLREVNQTSLNKNIPLILKRLTGVGPPDVSDAIAARVENLFTKAIEIGERVRRDGRINRNYYPYYIYKILDALVPLSDGETRRALYYIYIQSRETVEADDADWERICAELGELDYVPTDRSMAARYRPQ